LALKYLHEDTTMPDRLVIAHRGASSEAAENTRTAFLEALAQNADGLETDVQLTADEVPVLWHDDDLGKLGLPERRIDEFTHEELLEMDFAGWFSPKQAGEPVLGLAEFLREFAPRTRLLVEIKQRDDEPSGRRRIKVRRCLEFAAPFRRAGAGIRFLSFDLPSLIYAHELDPDWPCVLNTGTIRSPEAAGRILRENAFLSALCLPIGHLDHAISDTVKGTGKKLAAYTCNSDEEICRALDLGVDWLISDLPSRARRLRDEGCPARPDR
jgi:glycerophosphoryl diester phosphodiesterase